MQNANIKMQNVIATQIFQQFVSEANIYILIFEF